VWVAVGVRKRTRPTRRALNDRKALRFEKVVHEVGSVAMSLPSGVFCRSCRDDGLNVKGGLTARGHLRMDWFSIETMRVAAMIEDADVLGMKSRRAVQGGNPDRRLAVELAFDVLWRLHRDMD